ncbi:MAG: hypothetical protein HYV95_05355 [Opitutae bacterium]|nr:hypothetical protein [Opitutae bacterium]
MAAGLIGMLALHLPGFAASAAVHDIRHYGAVSDGVTLNTSAINHAVNAAVQAGGGTVVVPAGRFLTGTIYLRSHVTLQLEAGAELLGSTELGDYPESPAPALDDSVPARRIRHLYPENLEYGRHSLIYAAGQENVAVVGAGRINGQGSHPNLSKQALRQRGVPERDAYLKRPYGLSFVGCVDVKVSGVTLVDMAFWCQDYLNCERVEVTGVTVDSRKNDANNDGIDIDGSRQVRVDNCRFNSGDDSICLKANLRDCEDVRITNCTLSSLANGVKFGTASNGGFRNIRISGITMHDVNAAGLALEIVDGGTMEDVQVSDITMTNVGAAVFVRLGDRGRRWMKPEDRAVGTVRNISISRVTATVFCPADARPLASSIAGLPGHPVENITLRDIRITNLRGHTLAEAEAISLGEIGEHAEDYPEYSMYGPLPGYGFFIRHARGISIQNLEIVCQEPDFRSAIVCDRAEDISIDGLRTTVQPGAQPVVRLHDVKGARLTGTRVSPDATTFLRVDGESSGVLLRGNDLKNVRTVVSLDQGLPVGTVTVVPDSP